MQYIGVVFNRPLNDDFVYSCPENKSPLFKRVLVDFHNKKTIGYVVKTYKKTDFNFTVKPVLDFLDETPLIRKEDYQLAVWIAGYFISSVGEALNLFFPFAKNIKDFPARLPAAKKKTCTPFKELNPEQLKAYNSIMEGAGRGAKFYLLFGVTGSGKTAVYLKLIEYYLRQGLQSMIILPEIALTPQLEDTVISYFRGEEVAVIHSRISPRLKYYYWHQIYHDKIKIILGARSAVFAPTAKLGLLILDEEHENSFKNNTVPRYDTRQVAQIKCRRKNAMMLLGSATPLLESFYNAQQHKYKLVTLNERFNKTAMPKTSFVNKKKDKYILAESIVKQIIKTVSSDKQVIVYLNKRGYANSVGCGECGNFFKCPNCNIALTYHYQKQVLICHYCDHKEQVPEECPVCHTKKLKNFGLGVERIYREIQERVADASLLRLDSDTATTAKKLAHILQVFKQKKANILIGTQMLTKGHNFPGVELVVIVAPEILLSLPDFRAPEKTFSQITQVSGRAGRGENQGKVLIQTKLPDESAISQGSRYDYAGFYKEQIAQRELFHYPPFVKLCRVIIRGSQHKTVVKQAQFLHSVFTTHFSASALVLGPGPCLLEKINNNHRWNFLFKIKNITEFLKQIHGFKESYRLLPGIYLEYDMEPFDIV